MKTKTRIAAFFIAAFMLLPMLVACVSPDTPAAPYVPDEPVQFETPTPRPQPVETPEPEEEPEEEEYEEEAPEDYIDLPHRGVWDGRLYENEFLGLRFILPIGWTAMDDDDIAEAMGAGAAYVGIFGADAASATFTDMMAINLQTGESVTIVFEQVPENVSLEQVVQMAANIVAIIGGEVIHIPDTINIGSSEFMSFVSIIDVMGMVAVTQQFIGLIEDHMVAIQVGYIDDGFSDIDDNAISNILAGFSDLSEPAPEIDEIEVAEVLLGTWAWDWDDSYTYVFLPDGTGTRGVPGEIEEFLWFAYDDHLVINNIESWTFTIDDSVLTIASRQVPGLVFSYIYRP